jgi:DNA-directed RNA polymerase specialized sigma24 family protein
MSFAKFVETQLPCMRRYAFAVLDDISRADACVEQVLKDLLEEWSRLGGASHAIRRVDLFVRLQGCLQNSSAAAASDRSRLVLLLLEMEQFSIDKVSLILGVPIEELWSLVNSEEYAAERASCTNRLIG